MDYKVQLSNFVEKLQQIKDRMVQKKVKELKMLTHSCGKYGTKVAFL